LSHRLLADARFHRALFSIDADLAAQARSGGCGECGGPLHAADYPRKPRGEPAGLGAEWARRHSFCCGADDCRRRLTPTSVRFLDRRVYTGVMVVLAAVLAQGLSARRVARLRSELGVDRSTLDRWRRWWREDVPQTGFWIELRGRLDRPVLARDLPASLLERVEGASEEERLLRFLHLVAPLSHSALMRARSARVA
jgi:transposase-like protein